MNQYEFNKKCVEVFGYNRNQIKNLLEQIKEADGEE